MLPDLLQFIQAVFLRWSNLITGGVVALLWLAYEKFADRQIPMRTFIYILSAGLFIAVFGAWREQVLKVRATRGLHAEIRQTAIGQNSQQACIVLFLTITNTGSPTIINGLNADIAFEGGKLSDVPAHEFGSDNQMNLPDGSVASIEPSDILYEKLVTPVLTGGLVQGYVQYRLPGISSKQLLENGCQITIHFQDAWQNKYVVMQKANGKDEMQKLLLIPGTGNPLAKPKPSVVPTPPSSTPDKGASPP
jgi:hypothetical protein